MKLSVDHRYFFALLRAGLWGVAEVPRELPDWYAILTLAKQHAVLGIVYDGISAVEIPVPSEPGTLRKLTGIIVSIERQNQLFAKTLTEVVSHLRDAGIRCVLLKGQGLAQYYPIPSHRQCGDIDLYVAPENYMGALAAMDAISTGQGEEDEKHTYFIVNDIVIEIHRSPLSLPGGRRDRRLKRWAGEQLRCDTQPWTKADGIVDIPGADFNAVFVLGHFHTHFLQEGAGLRQLCDWVMLLHANADKIDTTELERNLRRFRLWKPWKVYGCLAAEYLGLPQDKTIFYDPRYRQKACKALKDILFGGNFGKYRYGGAVPVAGQVDNVWHTTMRMIRIAAVFPADAARSLGKYYRLRIGRLLKGRYFKQTFKE